METPGPVYTWVRYPVSHSIGPRYTLPPARQKAPAGGYPGPGSIGGGYAVRPCGQERPTAPEKANGRRYPGGAGP